MWILGTYEATALFTLKPATATSSGGKTLLVPTPFSIKMALLDIVCRVEGRMAAEVAWEWVRAVRVALNPPLRIVVNNTFTKVLRQRRNPAEAGSADVGFFGRTIAYREYAYLGGAFDLGLETEVEANGERLTRWLYNLNYLGRRGSFIQLVAPPSYADVLPNDFIRLDEQVQGFTLGDVLLTQLDDTGEGLTFARADVFSGERIRLGKERVLKHVALPYRQVASSRRYTFYERSYL